MQRTQVTSSSIESIGYEEDMQVLEVEFRSGEVYAYFDVPNYLFDELLASHSIGAAFHTAIRNGNYHFEKIT